MLDLPSRTRGIARARPWSSVVALAALAPLTPACGPLIGDEPTRITHDASVPSDAPDAGACVNACAAGAVACDGSSAVRRCDVGPDGCARWTTTAACGSGTLCCAGACVASDETNCFACAARCADESPSCSASLRRCACTEDACRATGKTCDAATGACVACRALESAPLDGYEGSLDTPAADASARGAPVGLLRWRPSLGGVITDPGDVAGRAWCSGVLIGASSFLTAAHCLEGTSSRGVRWPQPAPGVDLRPADAARAMRVHFGRSTRHTEAPADAGVDASPDAGADTDDAYDVLDVTELRGGGLDYAILQLDGAPASAHGYARVAATLDHVERTMIAGFLSDERLAITRSSTLVAGGDRLRYDGLGSAGTADGAPIFDAATGLLVGLHVASACSREPLGASGLALASARPVSPILRSLVVGRRDDLDGDGTPDMIVHHPSTGVLEAWMIDGTHDRTRRDVRPLSEGLSAEWVVGSRADLDGDGHVDLVVQNPATGEVRAMLLGGPDGTTVLRHRTLSWPVAGTDWEMRGAGDFDNDGHADLLWFQHSTGRTAGWILGGVDGAEVSHDVSLGGRMDASTWELGGAGDFDRDGVDDLLWMRVDGTVVIWSLGGSARSSIMAQSVATWGAGGDHAWHPYRVVDVDDDGRVDILWRDDVKGRLGPWYMTGTGGVDVKYNGFVDATLDVTSGARLAR